MTTRVSTRRAKNGAHLRRRHWRRLRRSSCWLCMSGECVEDLRLTCGLESPLGWEESWDLVGMTFTKMSRRGRTHSSRSHWLGARTDAKQALPQRGESWTTMPGLLVVEVAQEAATTTTIMTVRLPARTLSRRRLGDGRFGRFSCLIGL